MSVARNDLWTAMSQIQARSASECKGSSLVYPLSIHSLALRACTAVLIFSIVLIGQQSVAQETIPGWHTNLDDACKLAESTGKPLFITFRCVR